jgi:hypothetical protein
MNIVPTVALSIPFASGNSFQQGKKTEAGASGLDQGVGGSNPLARLPRSVSRAASSLRGHAVSENRQVTVS